MGREELEASLGKGVRGMSALVQKVILHGQEVGTSSQPWLGEGGEQTRARTHRDRQKHASLWELEVGSEQRLEEGLVRVLAEACDLARGGHLNTQHGVGPPEAREAAGAAQQAGMESRMLFQAEGEAPSHLNMGALMPTKRAGRTGEARSGRPSPAVDTPIIACAQ